MLVRANLFGNLKRSVKYVLTKEVNGLLVPASLPEKSGHNKYQDFTNKELKLDSTVWAEGN